MAAIILSWKYNPKTLQVCSFISYKRAYYWKTDLLCHKWVKQNHNPSMHKLWIYYTDDKTETLSWQGNQTKTIPYIPSIILAVNSLMPHYLAQKYHFEHNWAQRQFCWKIELKIKISKLRFFPNNWVELNLDKCLDQTVKPCKYLQ